MKNTYLISIMCLTFFVRSFSQNSQTPTFSGYDSKTHSIVLDKVKEWVRSNVKNPELITDVSITDDVLISFDFENTIHGIELKGKYDSTSANAAVQKIMLDMEQVEPFHKDSTKQRIRNIAIQKEYDNYNEASLKFAKQLEDEKIQYKSKPIKEHIVTIKLTIESNTHRKLYFYFDEKYSSIIDVTSLKKYDYGHE